MQCAGGLFAGKRQSGSVFVSFSTACLFLYPLRATLAIARRTQFDGVELVVTPEVACRPRSSIAALCRTTDTRVISVHIPMGPRLPGWRNSAGMRVRTVRLAVATGARLVVLHGGYGIRRGSEYDRRFRQSLERCRAEMVGSDVRLTIENNDDHPYVVDDHAFLENLDRMDRYAADEGLGITLDTSHVGGPPDRLWQAWERLGSRVENIHLNNIWRGKSHQPPERGDLPLDRFLARVRADGYTGVVTLETSPRLLRLWSPPAAAASLARSRAYCTAANWASGPNGPVRATPRDAGHEERRLVRRPEPLEANADVRNAARPYDTRP